MSSINHYIANSTGELDKLTDMISKSLSTVIPIVEKELDAMQIDIIFISAASLAIPEYGIGGNSPGPNHVYVSFDPSSDKITQEGLNETLLHEIHHCMRWRNPGYGETLGEVMISEGMACLYEEQHGRGTPIYAKVSLKDDQIAKAKKLINSKSYSHNDWFFGGNGIDRWFAYSYGYRLCRNYLAKTNKKASEIVHVKAQEILDHSNI
jgi:uncharacterized protein YjaZ